MARDKGNGKSYEITKEKPATSFEMVLSVGSIGAAVGFFMTLVVGACTATFTLDGLLLVSLVFSVTGFILGVFLGWLILTYLGDFLGVLSFSKSAAPEVPSENFSASNEGTVASVPTSAVVEGDAGKSVDYVFPEFSPDNQ